MRYTVRPGDTYAKIAAKLCGNAARFPELARANPGVDPRRLAVGSTLNVPELWVQETGRAPVDTRPIGALASSSELAFAAASTAHLPREFFVRLIAIARKHRIGDAAWLLGTLYKESGLRRYAVNYQRQPDGTRRAVAFGLNQLTEVAAAAAGSRAGNLASLLTVPELEQLDDTDRYLSGVARHRKGLPYSLPVHVYLAWLAPAKMSTAVHPNDVVYPSGSIQAKQNSQTDGNKDGTITVGELDEWLRSAWNDRTFLAALLRLRAEEGGGAPPAPPGSDPTDPGRKTGPGAPYAPPSKLPMAIGIGVAMAAAGALYFYLEA